MQKVLRNLALSQKCPEGILKTICPFLVSRYCSGEWPKRVSIGTLNYNSVSKMPATRHFRDTFLFFVGKNAKLGVSGYLKIY